MAEDNQQRKEEPIIIKKKKGHGGHGAHGGAWKVAFADFMTAMMAFFIVMWILGQNDEVKKQVTAYFKDPGAFNFVTGKRAIPVDLEMVPDKGKGGGAESSDKKHDKFYFMIPPEDTTKHSDKEIEKTKIDSVKAQEKVQKLANELQEFLEKEKITKPELKEILSSIKIEITKEGLRIELIETQESLFFEVGSSKVSKQARDILTHLAKEIGKLPNYVEVEGHTDSRQYAGKNGYSNWDLSSDRANEARRILMSGGLWDGQTMKVTGFADKALRNPNNPFDVSNRRISILIKQMTSKDFYSNAQQK